LKKPIINRQLSSINRKGGIHLKHQKYMEQIMPLWLPNEKECLLAILENLIYEGLLATRKKLGYSPVCLVDKNFWTNVGLEFDKLLHAPDLMSMIRDFIPYFWLPDEISWSLIPLSDPGGSTNEMIEEFIKDWDVKWQEDGNVVLVEMVTPHIAQFVKDHREQIKRVITLLGPNLSHVCTNWGLQPEQYKALVSRDTLDILAPHVRWNMIYGSKIL
jgi:hypothetical protein